MSNQPNGSISRVDIEPSALGEYISLNSCPQFHKYKFDEEARKAEKQRKNWKEAFEPLNILLTKDGEDFEDDCIDELESQPCTLIEHEDIGDWHKSKSEIKEIIEKAQSKPAKYPPFVTTQTRFGEKIGAWPVHGDSDVMLIWPEEDGQLRIRIIDIKAAHEEKTYQQIQIAVYTLLLRKFLEANDLAENVTIEGGVWTRENTITGDRPSDFPVFDKLESCESDVRRVLKEGGEFDRWYTTDDEDVDYQLAPKCHGCAYREACYTNAIEDASLSLLGLSRGEQKTFEESGVTSLHDLAALAYAETEPKPFEYSGIKEDDNTVYGELLDEPGIGERLPTYVQQAQSLLSKFNIDDQSARGDDGVPWLVGAGNGSLPADDPPYDDADLSFERRSMIRTYLHVERDHLRDRITLMSAYVTSSLYEDAGYEPATVSKVSAPIPDDQQQAEQVEQTFLKEFFGELFDTIQDVGMKMGHPQHAPVHLYFYTHKEKQSLVESVKRNESLAIADPIRDLLGLRYGVNQQNTDQPMVSVVQPEIKARKAPKSPNIGLVPMMEEVRANQNVFYTSKDWEYTRSDGVEVDLSDAFSHNLFDYRVPYSQNGDKIDIVTDTDDTPDGFYPARVRQGASIPLEYIWAAQGKLNDKWIEAVKEDHEERKQSLEPFRWLDPDIKQHEITEEDIKALSKRFAHGLAHIERGFEYRNGNIAEQKNTLPLDELDKFTLGENSIVRAAKEFLELEHHTQREDLYSLYGQQPAQRVRSGQSVPMVVDSVETDDNNDIVMEGRLLYDGMFIENPDSVANSCRQKGDDGATSGSWMIANEIARNQNTIRSAKPNKIEKGFQVTINELDIENRSITATARQLPTGGSDYKHHHRLPETDEAEASDDIESVFVEPDKLFILDPQTDDITAQRSLNILKKSENNFLAQTLQKIIDGRLDNPQTTIFPKKYVEEFNDWMEDCKDVSNSPNSKQRDFMLKNTPQFSLLQGPPGTGKTSLTMAPTILSRVYAFARSDETFSGVVAGESNKAVDEVLEDVADHCQTYLDSDHSDLLRDLKLVRLVSEEPDDPHPLVDYIDYNEDEDAVDEVLERLRNQNDRSQQSFGEYDRTVREHILVFATPSRISGLINKLDRTIDENRDPEDWVEKDASFFDMLAVDEASMMRLPSFLLAGAFLHDHAQVLVGGDQRQMPPIAKHDWENESRRIIEELVPYLSALDYLRLLGGQDVDAVYEPEEVEMSSTTIEMTQLETTYRCHKTVSGFLQRHIYSKDDINYSAHDSETLSTPSPQTSALETVLDAESPLVLILHDDDTSQQSNPDEAALATGIVDGINPKDTAGVVTPHNAQRGVLSSDLPDDTEVDTVERFQGGQRDMIMVSATASDPDFLDAESDFILNPNRLNVAMSRMKKKLVVIASREVFNMVPPDVEKYNRSLLWKGLYEDMDVNNNDPEWEGTLDEFAPKGTLKDSDANKDTNVQVFTMGVDE